MSDSVVLSLVEGTRITFFREITNRDIDAFALLSGDTNPLHMDAAFAAATGFRDRVAHGALLAALVSRLVGIELSTRRTVLLNVNLHFAAPTFPGDVVEVSATVASVHPSAGVITLKIVIRCGDELRARGSAMVRVESEE